MTVDIINSDIRDYESGALVLDFYADWCQPCKNLAPILDKVSNEYEHVVVGKCNVDDNDELIDKYKIKNIPTLIFIKDGEVIDKLIGSKTSEQINEKFKQIV